MSQLIQITDKAGKAIEVAPLDLAQARAKLAEKSGQGYWRSLEELSEQPGFGNLLQREFPGQAPKDYAPLARRDFVKLMGAALALAGLSGCAFQPPEKIIGFVKAPEQHLSGIPLFYATSMPFMGYGLGLLARSNEGRPTKVEGNPDHPASKGRTDLWTQASVLNLYDPDRSQFTRQSGQSSDWDTFVGIASRAVAAVQPKGGEGLTLLTETLTSPTALKLISEIQRKLPRMKWHSYEPINRDNARAGVLLATGSDLHAVHHFDRADVIVSLDCDFLLEEPDRVINAREFISNRKLTDGERKMSRLYVAESTPSITGTQADHRIPMKAAEVDGFARALASAVGVAGVTGSATGDLATYVSEIATDLKANRGRVLVCAGAHQPPAVHAIAHAITATLGSTGANSAISYHAPVEGNTALHGAALQEMVDDMNAGRVQTVMILGANPGYSAPADLNFAAALKKVPLKVHHGPYEDETSVLCDWHVPETHYLEAWGDCRAVDGTASLVQPLVQPLYQAAKSQLELLTVLNGNSNVTPYDAVRDHYLAQRGGKDDMTFEKYWQKIVHDGVVPGTASPAVGASLKAGFAASLPAPTVVRGGLEVSFRPDPTIWDGRFANNGWLQECPKPVSKITWDNAFFVSPATAEKNGWATNNEATLTLNSKSVTGAIFLLPGQPDETVTVHLGYGRTNAGKIGTGPGFDANQIRTVAAPFIASGGELKKTGRVYKIATTSHHNLIAPKGKDTTWGNAILGNDDAKTKAINNVLVPESRELDIDGTHGRDLVRVGTLIEWNNHLDGKKATIPTDEVRDKRGVPLAYPKNPEKFRLAIEEIGRKEGEKPVQENRDSEGFPNFYPRDADYLATELYKDESLNVKAQAEAKAKGRDNAAHAWGMTVDLQSCIGCNACVIGCQSENNSAIVGKDQVLMGREMHWIRIDTYYRGSYENPEVYFEPMMCQHCEKAPCAPVCPFNAVANSPEGLNEQIYNRCVGTKYCENNCPYKVRRFNFLQYSDQQTPVIQLMQNPDVTVRSRGVMEKCTYCIQRITNAKWQAAKEERNVRDGEIQVACAQACPTDAIVFGDINDPKSRVSQLKRGPLTYGLLTDLNTMPRTSYLARFKNPNPALEALDKPGIMLGVHGSEGHSDEAESVAGH